MNTLSKKLILALTGVNLLTASSLHSWWRDRDYRDRDYYNDNDYSRRRGGVVRNLVGGTMDTAGMAANTALNVPADIVRGEPLF